MKKTFLTLIAAGALLAISGAPTSIGLARSAGDFLVDGSIVRGNSTIFDGDVVETASARSVVQLEGGQLTLAPESRARIYRNRTVLERGTGMFREASGQFFQADSLQIAPSAKDTVVQVDIKSGAGISVYAFAGNAQVRNSTGLLIASLHPGMALDFEDPKQAVGSTAVRMTGVVSSRDGKFFLTDSTTNVAAEVQGKDLGKYVGKHVVISGSVIPGATAAAGATEVVSVATISNLAAGGGAAAAAGLSLAAKAAIIGGIAVGGTVGGLAAAGTLGGSTASPN